MLRGWDSNRNNPFYGDTSDGPKSMSESSNPFDDGDSSDKPSNPFDSSDRPSNPFDADSSPDSGEREERPKNDNVGNTVTDNTDSPMATTNNVTPNQASHIRGDSGIFGDWERANARYEEETNAEDPLASPGNSSVNSGFGGWSVGTGIADTVVGNPFDAEDSEDSDDDEDEDIDEGRSTSPRAGQTKRYGLSMIKEEEREDSGSSSNDGNSGSNSTNATNKTMFDDVDLEAQPQNLPTSNNHGGYGHNHSHIRSTITNRFIQEFQTNPNLKFKIVVAVSMMLVVSCLVAVAAVTSNVKRNQPAYDKNDGAVELSVLLDDLESAIMTNEPTSSPSKVPSSSPTAKPTTKSPSASPSKIPTYDPTTVPTEYDPTSSPTEAPTEIVTTLSPSFPPTTDIPTLSPSRTPVTLTPTRDCTDDPGQYLTYNNKLRDCAWLDNGYNGAQSERKDLNCNGSDLGDACKYTCRLYNGCMTYLLSSLPQYTAENDVSIGDACDDKPGLFMSNGNVPRECSWLEEDRETAPAKKNLNCGTPLIAKTELGAMCPASCAGYNDCLAGGGMIVVGDDDDDSVKLVAPHPLSILNGQNVADDDDWDTDQPTPFPTSNLPTVWSTDYPTRPQDQCWDYDGEYLTHMGTYRHCRWLNRDDVEEKLEKNCGITDIGLNCLETCPCPYEMMDEKSLEDIVNVGDGGSVIPATPVVPTPAPTDAPVTLAAMGTFDDSGERLTLLPLADASISQRDPDENIGDSKRLNVAFVPDSDRERQGLLLFHLGLVTEAFAAKLHIYSVTSLNSDSQGGVVLKKMPGTYWSENEVTWSTVPNGDGPDEPIIAFIDDLESDTWYDIDVTAAVQDAIDNNEPYLGIRLVSDESVDMYFGSKERTNEPPTLVVDSSTPHPTSMPTYYPTWAPTPVPSYYPTSTPTSSPIYELTCMDRQGTFVSHTGESQKCSWLSEGNGSLKKSFNCQDQDSNAAFFCQKQCSAYNGCDDAHCTDMDGTFESHTGWGAQCSWLRTGQGTLKLEQNCGTEESPATELGRRCQATCGEYNGCAGTTS